MNVYALVHKRILDALGALQQADFRVEAERLGPGPGVRGEEGADESKQRRDHQRDAAVDAAWKLGFGRLPTADEKQTAIDYLKRTSLQRLCHLMFNMSEFVYVD